MPLIESAYHFLHHTTQTPPSALDMVLLAIKAIISCIGTFIILIGVLVGLYRYILFRFVPEKYLHNQNIGMNFIRRDLGLTIVLGLEFIIAADVVETTTTPDYYSIGILGIIVVIRTFLSYSLSKEISDLTPTEQKNLEN